jgi:hypothetical protein
VACDAEVVVVSLLFTRQGYHPVTFLCFSVSFFCFLHINLTCVILSVMCMGSAKSVWQVPLRSGVAFTMFLLGLLTG